MKEKSLPPGREFEQKLFGVAGKLDAIPPYLDFESAMRAVIEMPMAKFGPDGNLEDEYDPTKPNWGKLHELWSEVHKHLPRRSGGVRSGPMALYVSIGTPLDFYHGVDCFFRWMGVYITVDASLIFKSKVGTGKHRLKADILVRPHNLTKPGLEHLGKHIAEQLKERRRIARWAKRNHSFKEKDIDPS